MKILHYSLGLPPYRSGGLTKYMLDLMEEQVSQKEEVFLLYPGKIKIFDKNVNIVKNKEYKGIKVYEIINPLPVSLLDGIKDIQAYTKKIEGKLYEKFLKEIQPDVIHIHSLMGIHEEFFQIAKKMKIKIVFTSHDYFGICPRSNFCNYKKDVCQKYSNQDCSICCKNALSNKKILIMQSHIYKKLKDSFIVKKIRKHEKENRTFDDDTEVQIIDYKSLMDYYKKIFSYFDTFIFNSEIAKKKYNENLDINNYKVIPITHKNIQDRRTEKQYNSENLKIGFMSPQTEEKGYFVLLEVLDNLYSKNYKFTLDVFFKSIQNRNYIIEHEPYTYQQLNDIYKNIDVIIIPSKTESFGFTLLEAISFGVPAIVSEGVGASFILKNNDVGYVYKDKEELEKIVEKILKDREMLKKWNKNIVSMETSIFNMTEHAKKIKSVYVN